MAQKAPTTHAEFLKTIQDSQSTTFEYPLANLIQEKNDFFIGKEGGPSKIGGDYYLAPKASEADYIADLRTARGYPLNPSPFRLRLKVAVLIDPSGPVVNNTPNHIFVGRKQYLDRSNGKYKNSDFTRTIQTATGPVTKIYHYCDFPKGSVSKEQQVTKNTSGDNTATIDAWPELRQFLVAACYSEVREEGRLSELDWKITGIFPTILCEGHEYKNNIHSWNLFIVFFGTITDHIRLYSNSAGTVARAQPATQDVIAKELTARAQVNLVNPALGHSFKERGTIEVVTPGTTDPRTWLRTPSHESLIYTTLLHLT